MTALASRGSLLIAAEGPFLRFYHAKNSRYITSQRVFKAQAVHGIRICSQENAHVVKLVVWGGRLVRAFAINFTADDEECLTIYTSNVAKASDWIFDLAPRPKSLDDDMHYHRGMSVAVTAHNALLQVTCEQHDTGTSLENECAYLIMSSSSHTGSLTHFSQTYLSQNFRTYFKLPIHPLRSPSILGRSEPSPHRCWHGVRRNHLLVMV